jgi:ankyrin repeat protein
MIVCMNGHTGTAELLIAKGANVEAEDKVGQVSDIRCLRNEASTQRVGTRIPSQSLSMIVYVCSL